MEQVFIQRLILVFGTGWQENIAANVFMNHFAICTQASKCDRDILIELNGNLKGKDNWNTKNINAVVAIFLLLYIH